MVRLFALLAAALSLTVATPAYAKCGGNGGRVVGAVVGGLLGGLLGAKIDGGRKNTVGTLIGGTLGALAGGAIGKSLDKCEKEKFSEATETALNAPVGPGGKSKPAQWTSETREGVGGSVSVGAPITTGDGRVCRAARRVNYIDGQEMSDAPTFCRTPPSSAWTQTA